VSECPFCEIDYRRVIDDRTRALTVLDGYPVTDGHTLVIVRRHVGSFFDLSDDERKDCLQLIDSARRRLASADETISAWNIGINDGPVAGQTVPHAHIHLIPRRSGDVENPAGGVRHVIPNLGDWRAG